MTGLLALPAADVMRAKQRLTLGLETTEAEIDEAASVLASAVNDALAGANPLIEPFTEQPR